jgi:p21-activated kinase 1
MEEIKSTTRRLTKKPPASSSAHNSSLQSTSSFDSRFDNLSIRSNGSANSLHRAPSAPYPRSQNTAGHVRTGTSPGLYTSSNSSLDRQVPTASGGSPHLAGAEFKVPAKPALGKRFSNPTRPLNEKSSAEFVGAPFDGSSIFNNLDSTKASGYQNSLRRPPPPPLSHTSPDTRMMPPSLRSSASFSAGERSSSEKMFPPRVGENQLISPKRYSDETKEPKSGMLRKKSGFASFVGGLVGSPRRVAISAPENPVHVTHVGYDNQTGQFTVGLHMV